MGEKLWKQLSVHCVRMIERNFNLIVDLTMKRSSTQWNIIFKYVLKNFDNFENAGTYKALKANGYTKEMILEFIRKHSN